MEGRDWRREMEVDFSSYAGEPVYSNFDADNSVQPIRYIPSLPLWRGWDFGYRHPAVVFCQYVPADPNADYPTDRLHFLHELYPTLRSDEVPGIKTEDLVDLVQKTTAELFPDVEEIEDFVDPAGNQKKETSDYSSIEILEQKGISPEWNVVGRKNRISYARSYIEVADAFRINPHCTLGIKGFSSAYRYPDKATGGADRDMPDLGKRVQSEPYIHIMDAFEYIVACRLQVDRPVPRQFRKQEEEKIQDLATLYLGASEVQEERVDIKQWKGYNEYEVVGGDLIDEPSLLDAFLEI